MAAPGDPRLLRKSAATYAAHPENDQKKTGPSEDGPALF